MGAAREAEMMHLTSSEVSSVAHLFIWLVACRDSIYKVIYMPMYR